MSEWIIKNWVEIIGALTGLVYLYFEIKQKILLWPLGIITSVFYIVIFYTSKFYADMSLQFYYVFISIYGWYNWIKGAENKNSSLPVINLSKKLGVILFFIHLVILFFIYYILKHYTDSPVPFWDALTTSLSVMATWMLSKKIIELWFIWIFVNFVSMILYIYKGLYPTTILFLFYGLLSYKGYFEWKKDIKKD
ncbi:MAG: nicotinamide mononucleotide transporter [Bacteroidales bacterium]|nr:nicotinamide mononucleotide transporter [Bacteroidales bacterium]